MNCIEYFAKIRKFITFAGLSKLSGVSQKQISRYASGTSKPRQATIDKINSAVQNLATELLTIKTTKDGMVIRTKVV